MERKDLELDERFSILTDMAGSPGFIVLDTSSICDFIKSYNLSKKGDYETELKNVRENRRFTRYLRELVSEREDIFFPEEVKEEFDFFTYNSLMKKKRRRKRVSRRRSHSRGKNYDLDDKIHSLAKDVKVNLGHLIKERVRFSKEMKSLEDKIDNGVNEFLGGINETVLELSEDYFFRHYNKRRKRFAGGIPAHRQNDEKIMAKSFALSYSSPVTIISRDYDFSDIYSQIFLNLDKFSKNGVPFLPDFNMDLFLLNPDDSFIYFEPSFYLGKKNNLNCETS